MSVSKNLLAVGISMFCPKQKTNHVSIKVRQQKKLLTTFQYIRRSSSIIHCHSLRDPIQIKLRCQTPKRYTHAHESSIFQKNTNIKSLLI